MGGFALSWREQESWYCFHCANLPAKTKELIGTTFQQYDRSLKQRQHADRVPSDEANTVTQKWVIHMKTAKTMHFHLRVRVSGARWKNLSLPIVVAPTIISSQRWGVLCQMNLRRFDYTPAL